MNSKPISHSGEIKANKLSILIDTILSFLIDFLFIVKFNRRNVSKNKPITGSLRKEIAAKLDQAIKRRGLNYSRAAELLGIKRQTLWLYLTGKATPGGEILGRACRLWDIVLDVNGFQFAKDAFDVPQREKTKNLPVQLSLLDALKTLREDQLEIKILGQIGDTFEVKLRIKSATNTFPPVSRRA